MWQVVVKYSATPLLCQGMESDVAMATNSRRQALAETTPNGLTKHHPHIAFDDMCKVVERYALPPSPRAPVVALADWESAPTFALDDHLGVGFPEASADRLLNKCNPFLSGKRRANSEDLTSEALTVATDSSTMQERDADDATLVQPEGETIKQHKHPSELTTAAKDHSCASLIRRFEHLTAQSQIEEHRAHWDCVGYGRWVKCHE